MKTQDAGLVALTLVLASVAACASIAGADFDGLHAKGTGGAAGIDGTGHGGAGMGGHGGTVAAGGYGGAGVGGNGGASCVPACSDPAEPDCETVFCDNGTCKSDPRAVGTACANATKVCDGKGACVACNVDGDCKDAGKPSCVAKQCVPAGCKDGTKDGDETDVDCGGSCTGCDTDQVCAKNADCLSQVCIGLKCAAPTCSDGIKNGTESDVDCGGSCTGCGPSLKCGADGDCAGKQCDPGAHTCTPNCADGVKNNAESDVDCGGGVCGKCAAIHFVFEAGGGWNDKQGTPTTIGTELNRFCALTSAGGAFAGGGWVQVSIENGDWVLRGWNSGGWAACVTWKAGDAIVVEQPIQMPQGAAPVALGSASYRACFFVRVDAELGGAADGAEIDEIQGQLVLSGKGKASVTARCISWPASAGVTFTSDVPWNQGQGYVPLGSAESQACWLSGIAGHFVGGGEMIQTMVSAGDAGSDWYFGGISGQQGVGGRARCLQWQ